jgi:rubrerythrin
MPPFQQNRRFHTLTDAQKQAEYNRACNHIKGKNQQIRSMKYALMCALERVGEDEWNDIPLRPNEANIQAQIQTLQARIVERNQQPVDMGCVVCMTFYNDANEPRQPIVFRCGHHTCGQCAIEWLGRQQQSTCPSCRAPVTEFIMLYH